MPGSGDYAQREHAIYHWNTSTSYILELTGSNMLQYYGLSKWANRGLIIAVFDVDVSTQILLEGCDSSSVSPWNPTGDGWYLLDEVCPVGENYGKSFALADLNTVKPLRLRLRSSGPSTVVRLTITSKHISNTLRRR